MSSWAPVVIVVVNDTAQPIGEVRVVYAGHILAAKQIGPHAKARLQVDADREGDVDLAAVMGGVVREAPGAAHVKAHDDRIVELHVATDRIGAVYLQPRGSFDVWAARLGGIFGVAIAVWYYLWRRRRIRKARSGQTTTR